MKNLLIFIAIYTIFFILLSGVDYLISKVWKKFASRHQFNTDQNLHRELTELEKEAFQAYSALMRESMKVAEEDYRKRRKELEKNEQNDRKVAETCE